MIPIDNVLFASEMIGAVRGTDPETGFHYDDTKHPRLGPDLWQCCHAPIARDGHPGQAYRTGLTVDRIDPA